MNRPAILAPTLIEFVAAKSVLPRADVIWCGAGLARRNHLERNRLYVLCGLAGGLAADVRPGALLVPESVGLTDGRRFACDHDAVVALHCALKRSNGAVDTRPLLTASRMVVGGARSGWAGRGFAGVDMETGKLAELGARVATVRVVLDSTDHELSAEWERPLRALRRFRAWKELWWLARAAPRYAWRAARALRAGWGMLS